MRTLRDLLTTWENWSARDILTRALSCTRTADAREALNHGGLMDTPKVHALDALRDAAELVVLLNGWQWQAVYAARAEDGASWDEIGVATATSAEQARADYLGAIERQERYGLGGVEEYRRVL